MSSGFPRSHGPVGSAVSSVTMFIEFIVIRNREVKEKFFQSSRKAKNTLFELSGWK